MELYRSPKRLNTVMDGKMLAIITLSTSQAAFSLGEMKISLEHTFPATMLDLSEYAYLDESYSQNINFLPSKNS